MSKKSTAQQKVKYTIAPFFLALVFVQCVVSLYTVLKLQAELDHAALMQKIDIMKESQQKVYCPNPETNEAKLGIDNDK